MNPLGGEKGSVQNPMIRYASEVGWQYVREEDAIALRGGESSFLLRELFIKQIKKLNPGFIDDQLAEDLVKRIQRLPANIKGNLDAWEHLAGLKTVFVPSEKRERNVRFIDLDNIENNVFQVTDEFSFSNGTKTNRLDIVFLINGVPVLFSETKAAHEREGIAKALDQVRRYHCESPELLAVLQIFSLTHLIQFFYSATWSISRKNLFSWKEEASGNYESLVKKFLDRKRVAKVLTEYILFTRKDDELKKVVLRQHQVRAVEKIVDRAAETKKRGLIWHTQGSGKTYTMIVAAQKILRNPIFDNPTVLMLVDRNELESQLYGNLSSVGITNVDVTENKAHLQGLLRSDKKGLIVTMIHKFDGMPINMNMRKNIIVLVDEAHRTTSGTLGNYLLGALPNATYIGFTGTPIDKTAYGKGTFLTFGIDDKPKGYLDKYSIAESIEDGTTVPLRYSLAESDLKVDREVLEREFLDLKEAEGVSDIDELNKVLEKAVTLKNLLKNKNRVQKVAEHVARHYRETIEPMGYKAFLVAVDREACALYKKELDCQGIIPPEYSEVVYSPAANDPEELAEYHLSEEEEKRIRKAFVKPNVDPRILIVTEKLLTGFDAPILYCMYLDKPMRDHALLQTIARVNRPYEDHEGRKKPCGFVLDFVGIFDNLDKALKFDSADIEGIVENIDRLKGDFARMMDKGRSEYLSLLKEKTGDKAVEAVIDAFVDEDKRQKFYKFFKELEVNYEILSPDAFLSPHIKDYEALGEMFCVLRGSYEPSVLIDNELTRKTASLVQKHTESGPIIPPLEIIEIDANTLKKIEENKSNNGKILGMWGAVYRERERKGVSDPYLISIGEKAEALIAAYQKRQMDTKETLEEFKRLIQEIIDARNEQIRLGMETDVFSAYWLLKGENVKEPEKKAVQIMAVFQKYPYWKTSEKYEREVRSEMYRILADIPPTGKSETVKKMLRILKGVAQ